MVCKVFKREQTMESSRKTLLMTSALWGSTLRQKSAHRHRLPICITLLFPQCEEEWEEALRNGKAPDSYSKRIHQAAHRIQSPAATPQDSCYSTQEQDSIGTHTQATRTTTSPNTQRQRKIIVTQEEKRTQAKTDSHHTQPRQASTPGGDS